MKRRDLIKKLTLSPFAGGLLGTTLPLSLSASPGSPVKRDLFKELGVRTFINAAGTLTYMTGCIMRDEVVDAINYSVPHFCMIDELQDKVGERIAKLVHSEAATVTCGAFSAMTLGLAGILTGKDLKKVEALPQLEGTGMKSEVICQTSHDERYNHAFLNTGCKIVQVETAADVDKAVNEKTAMMHFLNIAAHHGKIKHEEWLALAKKHNIPASIDIAADVPPVSNLWKFNDMGFDLVFISGGKAIRGPQSAGLLMGRKHIVEAARLNAPPRGFNVGRGHKVNKEEILGMYVALEKFISLDHEKQWKEWEAGVAHIDQAVKNLKGVKTSISIPQLGNITPTLKIEWDQAVVKLTGKALRDKLRFGNPSIEAGFDGLPLYPSQKGSDSISAEEEAKLTGGNAVSVTVWMMKPGEEKIVAARFKEELTKGAT